MKLNKKLLMAALAGAIVVTGGVGTFAADQPAAAKNEAKVNLIKAKEEAIKELKAAGVTSELYLKQIENARTIYIVKALKAQLLKSHEESKTEETKAEWAKKQKEAIAKKVEDAKANALAELKKAGLGNEKNDFVKRVKAATTVYDVEQAKDAGLAWAKENLTTIDEWNKKNTKKPSTPEVEEKDPVLPSYPRLDNHYFMNGDSSTSDEGKTPGKEDKKPGETKKPETKKPEDKKPGETKKPEDKKPGENKKPEDKKPETKKPGKKENTDSPNKKKKEKAALPKAGSEAEILTLAAASLSSVAGAFISLKKRK